jgi:hypothetical protein
MSRVAWLPTTERGAGVGAAASLGWTPPLLLLLLLTLLLC